MVARDQTLRSDDVEELRKLEEMLWRAETRYDNTLMDKLFAQDFFEFGRSGKRYTRTELMLDPAPSTKIDAVLPLKNFKARLLSHNVVQLNYVSEVTNGEETQRANRSSIWSMTDSGWQLRFHQGTPT
jgi:hypothetical protein